ncbi:histidinol dehydrogenase [Candidatus Micrarchaeota archaeon]|nr:histidinol dehydrogenase [Candidatus Micrarchaeota archaeon]
MREVKTTETSTAKGEIRTDASYPEEIWKTAEKIIQTVRKDGDQALLRFSKEFDKQDLAATELGIPLTDCQKALLAIPSEVREALELSAERIREFNEKIRPKDVSWTDAFAEFSWRWTPVESVGIYVPGGTAAYPSSVLMAAIPAKQAGSRVTICTPPRPATVTLAACAVADVDAVFQVGGAQAIAAMTYGTETIQKVDRIIGPGGVFVDAAKRLCAKDVAIDFPAGPTELVAVAGPDADASQVAADLVAQAEHDVRAKVRLLALDEKTAEAVKKAVQEKVKKTARAAIVAQSIRNAVFQVVSREAAVEALNKGAFEHVALYGKAAGISGRIRNCGAVYVDTPPALGDYALGSNHVLPTGGFARSAGMLSILDFLKAVVTIRRTQKGLEKAAMAIAKSEGLFAHADSLE